MQRENKFRAWDKDAKTMIYSDKHNATDYETDYDFVTNLEGNIVCWWGVDYDDELGYPQTQSGILDNIMQYTGLKDKNSKEIYEGDIFKTQWPDCTCVVEWEEEGRFLGFTIRGERRIVYINRDPVKVEVIGNIYENPELLTQSTTDADTHQN